MRGNFGKSFWAAMCGFFYVGYLCSPGLMSLFSGIRPQNWFSHPEVLLYAAAAFAIICVVEFNSNYYTKK